MQPEQIIRQLEEIYNGQPWYGDSIAQKINAISEMEAFRQPAFGLHSIGEIVWHMVAWRKAAIEWLSGNADFCLDLNSPQDWPPYVTARELGWEKLKEQLADTQREIIHLLQDKADAFLSEIYSPKNYTFLFLLEGIIRHDVYHLGQIGLVWKIVAFEK